MVGLKTSDSIMLKFKTLTLGCKVNQAESDAISNQLEAHGWSAVNGNETADLCIINTCTVTQKASQKSRQTVRHAIRSHPNARILVTGCYAQVEPEVIRNIDGVDAVIGQNEKMNIPDTESVFPDDHAPGHLLTDDPFRHFPFTIPKTRTRPFLKIQDGCDAHCTYCIVPYARGRSRSMPSDLVLNNLHQLKAAGFREVVLSGIHLGCYGRDLNSGKTSLIDLLKKIEDEKAIGRVRLSSIEPVELTEDIIGLVATSNHICRHFHIPLQSGDNEILKKMHRPYTQEQFRKIVFTIHEIIPDVAIGMDVLIGFPGETDAAFHNTCSLIKELPVSYLHVFPFSSRKGTPASRYSDQIPAEVKKTRCRHMLNLGVQKKTAYYKKNLGKTLDVLIEETRDVETGHLKGVTSNYITVLTVGSDTMQNEIVRVKLDRLYGTNAVFGTVC